MNIFSLIFFFAFIVTVYLGIYVIKLDYRSRLNRAYFYLSCSIAFWLGAYIFLFPAQTKDEAWFWYRLASVGWCNLPGLALYFSLVMTQKEKILKQKLLIILIFLPGIIFTYKSLTGILYTRDFIIKYSSIIELPPQDSNWALGYIIYNFTFVLVTFILIWRWGKRSNTLREKKQAKLFLITVVIATSFVYIFNVLGFYLKNINMPKIGHVFFVIWYVGVWYAISKYKMMVLTPDIAADEIISKMVDLLFLVNPDRKIIMINPITEELLGYKENELIKEPIDMLISTKDRIFDIIRAAEDSDSHQYNLELDLITKNGEQLPVTLSCSQLKDRANDIIGYVLVAHDIRQMRELAEERNKLKIRNEIIEKEMIMARKIQMQSIPSQSPANNISFFYRPVDMVGGDFFDFIIFRETNMIGIFISDVSGHGVPAAFITSMIKSFILRAGKIRHNPAEFLTHLNDFLLNHTGENFVTALYGIYNQKKNNFIYSNAGHNLPYLIFSDRIEQLPSGNRSIPLAILDSKGIEEMNKEYGNTTIVLQEKSKLLLYTDGLIEVVNKNDMSVDFGEKCLESVMSEYRDLSSNLFLDKIYENLVEFRSNDEFEDDICMICIDIERELL